MVTTPPATPLDELDRVIRRVAGHKQRWTTISYAQRERLLDRLLEHTREQAPEIVAKANHAKGLAPGHPCYGEDWMTFAAVTVANLARLRESYNQLADQGRLGVPGKIRTRPDGRIEVDVYPARIWDPMLFPGFRGRVVMQPGVDASNLADTQAVHLRDGAGPGALCFVLGAGNVASIPFQDSLYKLFVENQVVVLKLSPVNAYIGPHLRQAFRPLVDTGFFDVVYGGGEQGVAGCNHDEVDTLHVTGSGDTYDAVVWGPPEGRAQRKADGRRVNPRPMTAELGNVTPILVVPGDWTERDLATQAVNIASMVTNNASFNCIAGKLLVTARDWPLREQLLDRLRTVLRGVPARPAYYPGAQDRWERFVDTHPTAEPLVDHDDGSLPWTLIPDLDPTRTDDVSFTTEPFCPVLSETALPGDDPDAFLSAAVRFVNDVVFGTLSASVLIHPRTRRDAVMARSLERAIDELRYGSVVVNHWAGIPYGFPAFPWGAAPGHTPEAIGSGIGSVHNVHMFERVEKSVLEGPFRIVAKPPWFVTHRRAAAVGRQLMEFETSSRFARPLRLLPLGWNALLG